MIMYPTGYPLYSESIKSRTLVESHANGCCIFGMATVLSRKYSNMVLTFRLLTSNVDMLPIILSCCGNRLG